MGAKAAPLRLIGQSFLRTNQRLEALIFSTLSQLRLLAIVGVAIATDLSLRVRLRTMASQRLLWIRVCLLGCLASVGLARPPQAPEVNRDLWSQFNSSFLHILERGSAEERAEYVDYPWWVRPFLMEPLKYRPSLVRGEGNSDCWRDPNSDSWPDCEQRMQSGWMGQAAQSYATMMLQFDPFDYGPARFVQLKLGDGVELKGFLALQPGSRARPLVIMRLGIFSNVTQFLPERYVFQSLFEQGNAHVLVLESSSSAEYLQRNRSLAIGGFDEGLQNYLLARNLQKADEPLSRLISEVQLAAVSLGGHGAFFAAALNEWNSPRVISAFLLICPLVNFKGTLDFHFNHPWHRPVVEAWSRSRLRLLPKFWPHIDEAQMLQSLQNHFINHYVPPREQAQRVKLPPELNQWLGAKDFWKLNDWWQLYPKLKVPMRILATVEDDFVPYHLNSGSPEFAKLSALQPAMSLFTFTAGNHCTFPGSHELFSISEMLQDVSSDKKARAGGLRRDGTRGDLDTSDRGQLAEVAVLKGEFANLLAQRAQSSGQILEWRPVHKSELQSLAHRLRWMWGLIEESSSANPESVSVVAGSSLDKSQSWGLEIWVREKTPNGAWFIPLREWRRLTAKRVLVFLSPQQVAQLGARALFQESDLLDQKRQGKFSRSDSVELRPSPVAEVAQSKMEEAISGEDFPWQAEFDPNSREAFSQALWLAQHLRVRSTGDQLVVEAQQ